jgi:hypothetical protein
MFVALAVVAIMALSSVSVFATETAVATEVAAEAEPVVEVKNFEALSITAKKFYNARSVELGTYPEIADYDDLNTKILKDLEDNYALSGDAPYTDSSNIFNVSYKVDKDDDARYAAITVTYDFKVRFDTEPKPVSVTYYIDKETKAEIDKAAYDEGIKEAPPAETAPTEAAPAEEVVDEPAAEEGAVVIVQLRQYAEALGFVLAYSDETKNITLVSDTAGYTITVGENRYTTIDGDIIALEAAPEIQDNNYTYVPVSFFVKVLGAVYTVDEAGNNIIAWPSVAAE